MSLSAALATSVLATQAANGIAAVRSSTATAATPSKKVVIQKFTGTSVEADRWGPVQVKITIRKTTTVNAAAGCALDAHLHLPVGVADGAAGDDVGVVAACPAQSRLLALGHAAHQGVTRRRNQVPVAME